MQPPSLSFRDEWNGSTILTQKRSHQRQQTHKCHRVSEHLKVRRTQVSVGQTELEPRPPQRQPQCEPLPVLGVEKPRQGARYPGPLALSVLISEIYCCLLNKQSHWSFKSPVQTDDQEEGVIFQPQHYLFIVHPLPLTPKTESRLVHFIFRSSSLWHR